MTSHRRKGLLFILVGPTGAGKNTLMNHVLAELHDLTQLPTATTREIRPSEKEGREHHFVSQETFEKMIHNDELLEHQNVHGRLYGVPRQTVANAINAEQDRIADIDVLGAMNVRAAFPDNTIIIFVQPGASDDVLGTVRSRLEERGETAEEIETRLQRIPLEMSYAPLCDYLLVNENLETAARTLYGIIMAERSRRALLNLRAKKHHPRHRILQQVAAIVYHDRQILLHNGKVPRQTIAPGEYPNEAAQRALPETINIALQDLLGLTTSARTYYDELTFWYQGNVAEPPTLPHGWEWAEPNNDYIPVEFYNTEPDKTYS